MKDEARQPGVDSRAGAGKGGESANGQGAVPGRTALSDAGGEAGGLPGDLRQKYETTLGADLGGVRIHTGSSAAAQADEHGARAYAEGQNIYFGAGQYDPSSAAGEQLLAHEVAHTVQQAGGGGGVPKVQLKASGMTTPGDRHEVEADRAADAMVAGKSFSINEHSGVQIARQSSGEREFLNALSILGAFRDPTGGMVNVELRRLMQAGFGPGAHDYLHWALTNFNKVACMGGPEYVRYFEGNIHNLLKNAWIGPPTAHKALMLVEEHESVTTQLAEGKSPAKVAMKHALEHKKERDAMDSDPQRSNKNVLVQAFQKVLLSPFHSTAEYEAAHGNYQDAGPGANVRAMRPQVQTVLVKFADAASKKDAHLFPEACMHGLTGLIGPRGEVDAFLRAKALLNGAKADKLAPGEFGPDKKDGEGGDKLEAALKILEKSHIKLLAPMTEFVSTAIKLTKATDAAEVSADITGLAKAVFETVQQIVEMTGAQAEVAIQACETLEVVGKVLNYAGSAAMAVHHLILAYKANNPRDRFNAITDLMGDVPGPVGAAIKISFATLGWLGEMGNEVRVASKDAGLKNYFYNADAPIAPVRVPAMLKAKIKMIRDLPVDAQHARGTFGMLDPNPSDPDASCQQIFQTLEARRGWAQAARSLHERYRQGARVGITNMNWNTKPGADPEMDDAHVEAANAMKAAAEQFIRAKISEYEKKTGAVDRD